MIYMNREIATMTSSTPFKLQLRSQSKSKFASICNIIRKDRVMHCNESDGKSIETSVTVNAGYALTTLLQFIFNIQIILPFLLLLVFASGAITVNGLKCYMCGQYNEGVGSITPCLNYSEKHQFLYLKECSKKSEKYCVSDGPAQIHLQEVTLKIYSDKECRERHDNVTTNHQICGGVDEGYKGQCSGDSGGPLIYDNHIQLGIVSWSIKPCTRPPYPGVYTKVSHYVHWIYTNMNK